MFATGNIGTYTHRIHQLPEMVADVDLFITEANDNYLSIVSLNVSGKWERELRKRKYIFSHDPTYLTTQMLGGSIFINYILDENGFTLFDEQFGSGILPEIQTEPYSPVPVLVLANDNGNGTTEYEINWTYQETVVFPRANSYFDLEVWNDAPAVMFSTGLDTNIYTDNVYADPAAPFDVNQAVLQKFRYRHGITTGQWVEF